MPDDFLTANQRSRLGAFIATVGQQTGFSLFAIPDSHEISKSCLSAPRKPIE
jgi:hypothetical protein